MDAPYNQVFFPQTFSELFNAWRRFPDAVPYAGGTGLLSCQGKRPDAAIVLPANIISLDRVEELKLITRTERSIEIGAMAPLCDIISLGKILPEAFTQSLKGIGDPQLRNLATLGGNICNPVLRKDSAAPLIALDAQYELRSAFQSRWISASRFSSLLGPPALNPQELLTRIRIPRESWNYSLYKKFRRPDMDSPPGAIVCVARIQKNMLTDIRVIFAGETVLRDQESEAALAGKRLPLDRREAVHFTGLWEAYLAAEEKLEPVQRSIIRNFIESAVFALTD